MMYGQQQQQPQHQQQQQQPQQYQFYGGGPGNVMMGMGPTGMIGGGGGGGGGAGMAGSGAVVMVSGLQKSDENVMLLYNLMSFWGNIKAIKFLGKKENVAAVEYTSPEEAVNAYALCKGCNLCFFICFCFCFVFFFCFFFNHTAGASIGGVPVVVTTSRFPNVQV